MPRRLRLAVSFLCAVGLCAGAWSPPAAAAVGDFAFFHEAVMGTSLELRVRADSVDSAGAAEARVLAEIDRLSAVFSGYDPDSEFSRWLRSDGRPVKVSPELFEVLALCDLWRSRTGGAFDPRAAALTRLWSACEREGREPTGPETASAREAMAHPAWALDPAERTAARRSACPLTLDGIAKGYIVGRACGAGPGPGVRGVLLNVGGDMRVCGDMEQTVGVADPAADSESSEPIARFVVRDRAVSTSGSSQRGFRVGGKRYSHVFDPRTGRPAGRTAVATVVAPSSADADALATAFNVLAPDECLRLAGSLPGVECLIVTADGRVARSPGWPGVGSPVPVPTATALAAADPPKVPDAKPAAADAPWGDGFEMRVDFEINRPEAEKGRYRRPYVAIWVEDKDGFPVRNLTLWVSLGGSGPFQWLPDLKRWYTSDQARKKVDKTDMVLTVARPTRPPGKYSVIWDGKDDHGKPVPRGDYTVCIDAAREHGTYQGMRTPVTLAETPFAEELKGGPEIKAASVEYRRRKTPAK